MWDIAKILIGFALGLLIPFTIRSLTRYFLGPKLTVKFDADEVPAGEGMTSAPAYFGRVRLENATPTVARECRGYLVKIQEVGGAGPYRTLLDETFQLIWSYDDKRDSLDLPRGPTPTIDVVTYHQGASTFGACFRSSEGGILQPTKFDGLFPSVGIYRFTVLVTGNDVDPVTRVFEVNYDGHNWPPTGAVILAK